MKVDDIRALLAEATLPWSVVQDGEYVAVQCNPADADNYVPFGYPFDDSVRDARLAAIAVNLLPALLDAVEAADAFASLIGRPCGVCGGEAGR